jgi:hypothetical protein
MKETYAYRRRNESGCHRRSTILGASRVILFACTSILTMFLGPKPASSQAPAGTVRVTVAIDEIWLFECDDPVSSPDPYFHIKIDGVELNPKSYQIPYGGGKVQPSNAIYSMPVDISKPSIPIEIQLWEADFPWSFDDHCDINPLTGNGVNDLYISLNPRTCDLTGDVNGSCGKIFTETGTGDEAATVEFHIAVDNSQAPGLYVACLHDPLWPEVNQPIQIHAEARDDNNNTIPVDSMEIYVNGSPTPAATTSSQDSVDYTVSTALNSLSYMCRAVLDGQQTDTGWRFVRVGDVISSVNEVPILYTRNPSASLDVEYVADKNTLTYTGARNAQFLSDIHSAIWNGWYGNIEFLKWQGYMNFWLATSMGIVRSDCKFEFAGAADFRDVGIILQNSVAGDGCTHRANKLAQFNPNNIKAEMHEAGHSPFGLSDEYPGPHPQNQHTDYFQPPSHPNIYKTEKECQGDAPNLHRLPADCRGFTGNTNSETWYTSEPNFNDLMHDDGDPQAADIRRIEDFFKRCEGSGC